jgi:Tfp pilus assembly protein PilF
MNCHLTWHHLMAREFDLALGQAERTLELNHHSPWGHLFLGWSHGHLGQTATAVDHFRRAIECGGDSPVLLVGLAYGYAQAGDPVCARQVLTKLEQAATRRYVSSYEMALVHAWLGEIDRAFERLEHALLERSGWLPYLLIDPRMDVLSSDPRFDGLAERVGQKRRRAMVV